MIFVPSVAAGVQGEDDGTVEFGVGAGLRVRVWCGGSEWICRTNWCATRRSVSWMPVWPCCTTLGHAGRVAYKVYFMSIFAGLVSRMA